MIVKDNLPLNTSEKEGFKFLLKTIAPLYAVPSRTKISSLIEERYDLLACLIKKKLQSVPNITLTTDVWTETMSTKSFLGVTSHFLTEKALTSVTIGVFELNERHNSEYLGNCLISICNDWQISDTKITAIVTDNGANIVKAVCDKFGKNRHLPCFAHTLDLVASKITEEVEHVKHIIDKVKSIVTYFKQSVHAADELRKAQPVNNILKPLQSVPTRWNSQFYMLERFTKLYTYIVPILLKNPKSPVIVDAADLEKIKEFLDVLSPIESVSREICGEHYLTSSKIIPMINCLLTKIEKLTPVTEEGEALKVITLKEISKRFGSIEHNKLLAVSSILDPRFKRLHFNQPVACASAVTFINKCIQEFQKESSTSEAATSMGTAVTKDDSIWAHHNELASKLTENRSESTGELDFDFKFYLNSPTMPLDHSDPFIYWQNFNTSIILQQLAKKYLSVVGTSVPSERLFSKAGNIISQSRNRLSGKMLSKLLFLNSLGIEDWNF